ncbi:hypothetical protein [Auritidibacter ignavus]|uniref:hypothetical protein n=1 Tax=Auritidibacter ignavus TaxID=678932 RepID=UPI002FE58BF2
MPFRDTGLMSPDFQTPRGNRFDHQPPVVSIVPSGADMDAGVRLHHNQQKEGYFLSKDVEGLGVAPISVKTADLASGGSVFRHARLESGELFLPIHVHSPVPSTLPGMYDRLIQIVQPAQSTFFDVVVFDPYLQESRTKRAMATEVTDPVRKNPWWWTVGITAEFMDPFWYGQKRELSRRLGRLEKKFVTAKPGQTGQGYEVPFFPIMVGGSTLQYEYVLQVAGDAPAYWEAVVTGPGEDFQIMNETGDELFIPGRIESPVLIKTRPQEQDITLTDGTPVWERVPVGRDSLFPLLPGRNVVRMSMVGAAPQSEIRLRYRETFFHSIGGVSSKS